VAGPPKAVAAEFRANLEKSFRELQLEEGGYLDLFSIHGMNRPEHLDWVFGPGGCWEVVEEYRKQGKIRFVGFSSHGSADVITSAIDTGRFDYCNIHHHFIGSYVCTGTGPVGGTRSCIEAAKKHDMGVFIISPADKGGGKAQLATPRVRHLFNTHFTPTISLAVSAVRASEGFSKGLRPADAHRVQRAVFVVVRPAHPHVGHWRRASGGLRRTRRSGHAVRQTHGTGPAHRGPSPENGDRPHGQRRLF